MISKTFLDNSDSAIVSVLSHSWGPSILVLNVNVEDLANLDKINPKNTNTQSSTTKRRIILMMTLSSRLPQDFPLIPGRGKVLT